MIDKYLAFFSCTYFVYMKEISIKNTFHNKINRSFKKSMAKDTRNKFMLNLKFLTLYLHMYNDIMTQCYQLNKLHNRQSICRKYFTSNSTL